MKRINITDITLKRLSGDRNVSLLFREKTAIAACADSLGADAVELAAIQNLREDTIIYKTIAKNIKNSVVAIPAGFSEQEIAAAFECVKEAAHPRLQIEVPASTVQMEYIYHIKADKMIEKIGKLVAEAKKLCEDVEFSAVDATRADEDFLIAAVKAAQANGAGIVTLCDTAGVSLPYEIEALIKKVKQEISVPVYAELSDKLGMAAASAIAAISAGADGLKCTMAESGALLMGEISDLLTARGNAVGAEVSLKNTKIHASIEELLAGIKHEAYSTFAEPDEKKDMLFDSETTLSQVSQAAKLLGYELSDGDLGNVYKNLSRLCEKKGSAGARELEAVIASVAMQVPSTYHLENYTTSCSNLTGAMSQVTLKCDDELIRGVSTGDGPVDSVFRAVEQAIGHHYELDDFQVQAVTEGKEALGTAIVKLRNNGKLYAGTGVSTDIVAASIRAYLNALNKIVFEG